MKRLIAALITAAALTACSSHTVTLVRNNDGVCTFELHQNDNNDSDFDIVEPIPCTIEPGVHVVTDTRDEGQNG